MGSGGLVNAAGAVPGGQIGEDHEPKAHLIPLILDATLCRKPAVHIFRTDYQTSDGTASRDYAHVSRSGPRACPRAQAFARRRRYYCGKSRKRVGCLRQGNDRFGAFNHRGENRRAQCIASSRAPHSGRCSLTRQATPRLVCRPLGSCDHHHRRLALAQKTVPRTRAVRIIGQLAGQ